MGATLNLTGQRFGRLMAVARTQERKSYSIAWLCVCDCGKQSVVTRQSLQCGNTKSCGCLADDTRRAAGQKSLKDLVGQRFGRLVVSKRSGIRKGGKATWLCRCDCGNETTVYGCALRSGQTRSCGCLRRRQRATDLTGRRFGRLWVTRPFGVRDKYRRTWLCRCECGSEVIVEGANLRSGHTTSCGCWRSAKHKRQIRRHRAKRLAEIQGQRFHWLVVVGRRAGPGMKTICRCKCGNVVTVARHNLVSGRTQSCGCKNLSLETRAKQTRSRNYPNCTLNDVQEYLRLKHAIRKVEQCLTQTK